jgi:predicted NUDIX family NTP pyrophosphohydrolase
MILKEDLTNSEKDCHVITTDVVMVYVNERVLCMLMMKSECNMLELNEDHGSMMKYDEVMRKCFDSVTKFNINGKY